MEARKSLNFYKYLCQTIGSEEVVRIRRLVITINDIGRELKEITSGSKGEGLDFKSSDLDKMVIDPTFKVYQSEIEVPGLLSNIPLIMNTEETLPCFTQLCLPDHSLTVNMKGSIQVINMLQTSLLGRKLSSKQYKLFYLSLLSKFLPKIHGPCLSDEKDEFDQACCLKCDKWICQATPWVSRPRKTWPLPEIISNIISCGVLFVPIGNKGSINEHLEWRISFSVAEKFLIFSFSHTQLLCYAMLKIFLKEIKDKHEDLKDSLCSFFLKTLMFWILEETERNIWRPDNIIPCLMACLQRLLYSVRYSILPHYFIPDNNLFFLRFNTNNKEKMTSILTSLYEQGINGLPFSETRQYYQSQSYEITGSLKSRHMRLLQQIMPTLYWFLCNGDGDRFSGLLYDFLHHSRTRLSRGLFALNLSRAYMNTTETITYRYGRGNKHHYCRYKQVISPLLIGLHSDAVSGLLKLASFFCVQKDYFASLTVITYTLQKCTDEKIDILKHKTTFNHIQKHVLNLMKNEKLNTIIKSLMILPITFSDSSIFPQELQLEVSPCCWVLHPLPFTYFLSFLCYFHLHHITSCRQSLHQLCYVERTLSEFRTKVSCPDSVNSIILCGIAHQLLGETYSAKHAFQEAARFDPKNITSAATRLSSLV